MAMPSKYNSFCQKCKHKINIGDMIERDAGLAKWVHVDCPSSGFEAGKRNRQAQPGAALGANALTNAINLAGTNQPHAIIDETDTVGDLQMDWIPSKYQQGIFDFITDGKGNGVAEAVAGSGKTTTLVRALSLVPKDARVAFLAFNSHIAKEIGDKLIQKGLGHIHCSTIHSLGLKIIRKLPEFKIKNGIDKDKLGGIMDAFWPMHKSDDITDGQRKVNYIRRTIMRRVVSLAKATLIDVQDGNAINEMLEKYGFDSSGVVEHVYIVIEKLPEVMQQCLDNVETIDYDDMIWLPLVHRRLKMNFEKFDYIFVDEAQDLNASQIQFVLNSAYDYSRIVCVGDRRQSLYGFRGADTDAIPNLIEGLQATVLPLSISYRCPKLHVELAKQIVPQIEAADNAVEGKVSDIDYKEFLKVIEPGDIVVCRTNAPLVKPAFEAIKAGKKAVIRGQDIGHELVNYVERFQAMNLSQLSIDMSEFTEKEFNRLMDKGKELQAEMVKDKTETVLTVANECTTVAELVQKLEMLFSNSNVGVVFSSVHRAKGLEADRVFILKPELMPHPKAKQGWEQVQEENCKYVALTRSKNELYFVQGDK